MTDISSRAPGHRENTDETALSLEMFILLDLLYLSHAGKRRDR